MTENGVYAAAFYYTFQTDHRLQFFHKVNQ